MTAFSLVERIAVAATRLPAPERELFDDLFADGLTAEEARERRGLTPERFKAMHNSMMRSLCGVSEAANGDIA